MASISKASGSGLSTLCAPTTTLAERAPSAQWAAVKTQSFEINDALKDIGRKLVRWLKICLKDQFGKVSVTNFVLGN